MYFPKSKRRVLLDSIDDEYDIVVANRIYVVSGSIERLWLYYIYGKNCGRSDIASWLRYCLKVDVNQTEIESAINLFIQSHKTEVIEDFSYQMMQPFATKENDLWLPIVGEGIYITEGTERVLLNKIIENPNAEVILELDRFFFKYINKHGYIFKGDLEDIARQLTSSFLEQHGINADEMTLSKKKRVEIVVGYLVKFTLYIVSVCVLFKLADVSTDSSLLFLPFFLYAAAVIVLTYPFLKFFGKI